MANSELHIKDSTSDSWRAMTSDDLAIFGTVVTNAGTFAVQESNPFVADEFAADGDFTIAAVAGQSHYVTYIEGGNVAAAITDGNWTVTPGATTLNFQGAPLKAAENTAITKVGTITAMLYFTQ